MNRFLALPTTERRQLCEEAAARLGLDAASLEKDFWVCWTLRELFSIPEIGGHLTFKGGTSRGALTLASGGDGSQVDT